MVSLPSHFSGVMMDQLHPLKAQKRTWHPSSFIWLSLVIHVLVVGYLALKPKEWPLALEVLAFNHLMLTALGLWPKSTLLGPNRLRLPLQKGQPKRVALTFDDGPDPLVTPRILDLLDASSATATFFLIGDQALKYPELVREILARGHTIGNHSQQHRLGFACSSVEGFIKEVGEAQASMMSLTGQQPRFFRAPFGIRSPLLEPALCKLGLHLVSWTRRGYDTRERHPQKVLGRLLRGLNDGDILLLHDGHSATSDNQQPVVLEVLPILLKHLQDDGYQSVGLDEGIPP